MTRRTYPGVYEYGTSDGTRWRFVTDGPTEPTYWCDACRKRAGVVRHGKKESCSRCDGALEVRDLRQQLERGGFTGPKAALAAKKLADEVAGRGEPIAPTKQTVASFVEEWLVTQRARVELGDGLKIGTLRGYESRLHVAILPAIGHMPIAGVTTARCDKLLGDYAKQGKNPKNVALLGHKLFEDARRAGRIQKNPFADAITPKITKRSPTWWSAQELGRFVREVAPTHRLGAAFVLLGTTGARRGEALTTWDAIDLDAGEWTIDATLIMVHGDVVASTPKTTGSVRTITLDDETIAALRQWKRTQAEERLRLGADYEVSGYVFTDEFGRPVKPDQFSRIFTQLVKAAELPPIRLHDVRHSYASAWVNSGANLFVLSRRLGHSSYAITADTYSHVDRSADAEGATKVAGLIFGVER